MKKQFLFLLIALLCFPITLAATLEGTIYDISLEMTEDVRISIDTTPSQLIISKDSTYSFNIPVGDYTLTAEQYEGNTLIASAEESINIQDDGTYVLDIILFPTFEEIEDESDFIDSSVDELIDAPNYNFIIILGIILIIIAIFFYFTKKQKIKNIPSVKKQKIRKPVKKAISKVEKNITNLASRFIRIIYIYTKTEEGNSKRDKKSNTFIRSKDKFDDCRSRIKKYNKKSQERKGEHNNFKIINLIHSALI